MSLKEMTTEELKEYYKLRTSKRVNLIHTNQQTFDYKSAYHLLRLLDYAEQIMTDGDIDLRKNNEKWKAVRRGEVTPEEINEIFNLKEKQLETLYETSNLQHTPNESKIKGVLLQCLEQHYGNLSTMIQIQGRERDCIEDIKQILNKYDY